MLVLGKSKTVFSLHVSVRVVVVPLLVRLHLYLQRDCYLAKLTL